VAAASPENFPVKENLLVNRGDIAKGGGGFQQRGPFFSKSEKRKGKNLTQERKGRGGGKMQVDPIRGKKRRVGRENLRKRWLGGRICCPECL